MKLTAGEWMLAVSAANNSVVRETGLDTERAVRSLRRKLKGKHKAELESCARVVAAARDQALQLIRRETERMTKRDGEFARLEDLPFERLHAGLNERFPFIPPQSLGAILNEVIYWHYLR